MTPPAQQRQKGRSFARIARFAKDASAQSHRCIGAQHDIFGSRLNRHDLFARQTHAIGARQLATLGVFVNIGGKDSIRNNPQLRQKFLPARAA
jgi:hypothetical protein